MAIFLKRHDKHIDREAGFSVFQSLVRGHRQLKTLSDVEREQISAAIVEPDTIEHIKELYNELEKDEKTNARIIVGSIKAALVQDRDIRNLEAKWRLDIATPAGIVILAGVPALLVSGGAPVLLLLVGASGASVTGHFGLTGRSNRKIEQHRNRQIEQCNRLQEYMDADHDK